MNARGLGRLMFGFGMIGMGLISLICNNYSLQWEPVGGLLPNLGRLSGAILCLGGLGVLIGRFNMLAAAILTVFLGLWVFALQVPHALAAGGGDWKALSGTWLGFAEDLTLACGAWTLLALSDQDDNDAMAPWLTDARALRIAQALVGVACLIFGASHFAFADFTSTMIPSWIPARLPLAYITGAGHLLTGLALLSGVLARLAATLEALMMTLFVLLVHVPMLVAGPSADAAQLDWTMLFVAMSLSGAMWAVAGGLSTKPWGFGKSG